MWRDGAIDVFDTNQAYCGFFVVAGIPLTAVWLFAFLSIRGTATEQGLEQIRVQAKNSAARMQEPFDAIAFGTPASTMPALTTNIAATVMTAGLLKPANASVGPITSDRTSVRSTNRPITSGRIFSLPNRISAAEDLARLSEGLASVIRRLSLQGENLSGMDGLDGATDETPTDLVMAGANGA